MQSHDDPTLIGVPKIIREWPVATLREEDGR
jgi:hypothetical protein